MERTLKEPQKMTQPGGGREVACLRILSRLWVSESSEERWGAGQESHDCWLRTPDQPVLSAHHLAALQILTRSTCRGDASPKSRLSRVLLADQPQTHHPSLGSIHWSEQLTELREAWTQTTRLLRRTS